MQANVEVKGEKRITNDPRGIGYAIQRGRQLQMFNWTILPDTGAEVNLEIGSWPLEIGNSVFIGTGALGLGRQKAKITIEKNIKD